jgi:hypothetical protein
MEAKKYVDKICKIYSDWNMVKNNISMIKRNNQIEEVLNDYARSKVKNNVVLPDVSLSDGIEGEELLKGFTDWQKKYKDSSYVNMFDYKEYLKTL